jgi:hypothetical protein
LRSLHRHAMPVQAAIALMAYGRVEDREGRCAAFHFLHREATS